MAIKQIVPILITLQGDGSSTTFTYALGNLYQGGVGGSIPFGTAGVVPSSVTINNPPIAITSSTVDADGNITITFTAAPANATQYTLEVDLNYNSGAATSSSPTQAMNVNVTGGTIVASESFTGVPGSALPTNAAYMGGKNAGNLVGFSVDASGNLNSNLLLGGTAVAFGSHVSASSVPVVIASDQAAIPVSQSGTWNVGTVASITAAVTVAQATAANLNATVVGTGTFAVQATQSGTWNVGTVTSITNPVTVVGDAASGAAKAGNPVQIGGVFNTTQPTVTTGQMVEAQSTARGAQIVATGVDTFTVTATQATAASLNATVVGTGTFSVQASTANISSWGGTVLGTPTNFGTTPGAVIAASVNASLFSGTTALTNTSGALNVVAAQATAANLNATVVGTGTFAVQAAQSGTWNIGTVASITAAVTVAQATAANLNATVVGTGTFAVQAAQSGTWTVAQGTAAAVTAGWPVTLGQTAETTAAWTSGTTVNTAAALTVTGYGTVIVTLNQTTTLTGGVATFEVSDTSIGTNWYSVTGTQVSGFGTNSTYAFQASTNQSFQFDVTGFVQFRVRLSTVITGTGTVNVGIAAQASSSTTELTVGQLSAANLNATVVGTGTFAVQATQAGTWTTRVVGNAGAIVDGAQNTAAPANALVAAGVYNSSPITVSTTGNMTALQTDVNGFLKVNVSAGSSGNAAASATGSAVPASADFQGLNVAGTLRGWTGVNPSGSVYAGQIDLTSIAGSSTSTAATGVLKVGVVGNAGAAFDQAPGSAAPSNAVQIGATDGTNLRAVNATVKGTQGTYAVAVQALHDSGRTYVTWLVDAVANITTEALVSTQVNKGGTLQGAATTYTVTTGKTLRIQSIAASVQGSNSTVQYAKVRFRSAASVTASSPIVAGIMVSNSGATNSIGYGEMSYPECIEIAGGQQVGISYVNGAVNGSVTICVAGYEY